MINALSIDVEDWYQVSDFEMVINFSDWSQYESRLIENTRRLLDVLSRNNVKATFFILAWNAEHYPDLIRQIDREGHELATHGYAHRLIYEQTKEQFAEDIGKSIRIIESLTRKKVLGYRAPSFSITKESLWALDILLEKGLRYDSSIFPISDTLYGIKNNHRYPHIIRERKGRKLIEFPMSTIKVFHKNLPMAGGASFRLLPYSYMKWGIKWLNKKGIPSIIYLHPWEADPHQPRLRGIGKRGFSTHYINLDKTKNKLEQLLRDFKFAPANEVLSAYMGNSW